MALKAWIAVLLLATVIFAAGLAAAAMTPERLPGWVGAAAPPFALALVIGFVVTTLMLPRTLPNRR